MIRKISTLIKGGQIGKRTRRSADAGATTWTAARRAAGQDVSRQAWSAPGMGTAREAVSASQGELITDSRRSRFNAA